MRNRSTKYFSVFAALFVLSLPCNLHAQRRTITLAPGMRVQLVLTDSLWQDPLAPASLTIDGDLVRITRDSVYMRLHRSTPFGLARRDVKKLSISQGVSRPRSAIFFGIGLGILSGAAYALSNIGVHHRKPNAWEIAGIGFGVGAVIGAVSPYEDWRRVRMNN